MAAAPGKQQCREEQAQRHDGSPPFRSFSRGAASASFLLLATLCLDTSRGAGQLPRRAGSQSPTQLAAERCDEGATKASGSGSAPHAAPRHLQHAAKPVHSADRFEAGRAARVERHGLSVRSLPPNTAASYSPTCPPHRNSRCLISKRISIIGLNRKERPNLSAENDRAGIGASPESHGT